jgi:hypothetical protein
MKRYVTSMVLQDTATYIYLFMLVYAYMFGHITYNNEGSLPLELCSQNYVKSYLVLVQLIIIISHNLSTLRDAAVIVQMKHSSLTSDSELSRQ